MTTDATPPASRARGSRARATERSPRCDQPKAEDGRPCRRSAGRDTDHPGIGPCKLHDDGSWQRPPFAENEEARLAFLAAVAESPSTPIRELIEPLGYRKRDVTQLAEADSGFEDAYVESRGYDADAIRTELQKRAFSGGSDRLLEFIAKMRLPEGRDLLRHRFEGRLEVAAAPFVDLAKLTLDEQVELRRLLAKAQPEQEQLTAGQAPALELLPGGEVA